MSDREPPPIDVPATSMTVSAGWKSRDASLKGLLMGVTESTPDNAARRPMTWSLRRPTSPTTPMTTRCSPRLSCAVSPSASMWRRTSAISASVAETDMTTNMRLRGARRWAMEECRVGLAGQDAHERGRSESQRGPPQRTVQRQ